MQLTLYGPDGEPRGTVEVPDDVVSAANRVQVWLAQQMMQGAVAQLCGVMLVPPTQTAQPIPEVPGDTAPYVRLKPARDWE